MAKNEIRLRQKTLNPADILRYQDYPAIMKRHSRKKRLKRVVRFFTFSLIVTAVVLLLLIIISYVWFRVDKQRVEGKKPNQEHLSRR